MAPAAASSTRFARSSAGARPPSPAAEHAGKVRLVDVAGSPDAPDLLAFATSDDRVVACATGRRGGVSSAPYDSCNLSFGVGDDADDVLENRRRVCAALGFTIDDLVVANQVHGSEVVVVDESHRGTGALAGGAVADADALVTASAGLLLGVLLADCVPVVLVDPARGALGVAHAGWRGTVAHVVRHTVDTMVGRLGCRAEDLRATIGPSIGPRSYEVGPDVAEVASAAFPPDAHVLRREPDGRTTFDLWAANAHDLRSCGVHERHIEVCGVDTFTATDRFYSHRAGAPTGRFMALVARHAG